MAGGPVYLILKKTAGPCPTTNALSQAQYQIYVNIGIFRRLLS